MPSRNLAIEDTRNVKDITLKEFLWILKQIPVLRAWATTMEREALARLMRGDKLPGYKLVQGLSNRSWVDSVRAAKALIKLGFSIDDVTPREIVSPAQAEKLFKKAKRTKDFGKVAKIIQRLPGNITIASDDDPRRAYVRGEEFSEPVDQDETHEED